MPSTLTGLLLFLAMLMPGFVFVTTLRRERPEQRPSTLHETATIAVASVASEVVVLVVFLVGHAFAGSWTPDIGQLIAKPRDYLTMHYLSLFGWSVGLLLAACGVAWLAAFAVRRRPTHSSVSSAWWLLFETYCEGRDRHVGVLLDNGAYVQGILISFNQNADDTADRDLILMSPVSFRPPDAENTLELDIGAVCVSARHIVALTVAYIPLEPISAASALSEVGEIAVSPG